MAEEVQVPPTSQSDPFLLLVPISWAAISLLQQQIFVLEHNSSTFRDLYLLTVHQALHLLTAFDCQGTGMVQKADGLQRKPELASPSCISAPSLQVQE